MPLLGELEQRIMAVLWAAPAPLSVRDVQRALAVERDLAYTTVMTVLQRLNSKQRVTREHDGRAWLYRAASTQAELVAAEMHQMLDTAGRERNVVLAEFLEGLDQPQLTHLERLLAAKASVRGTT